MEFKKEDYLSFFDSTSLTQEEKFELIEYMWSIVKPVFDKHFGT